MIRHIVLVGLALAWQVNSQVLYDNFDPRVPRPGATLPASIDPYGWSRPLPPSIDPLGVSYRPAHAGAVLPALYDPLGASRPGGLPFALDPIGYTRTTDSTWGGRGYSAYGGSYGGGYDNYLARPSGFLTGVGGSPIFPDPNAAVPLYTGRVQGTYPPAPTVAMPVMPVSTVPVAPVAAVAPVAPVASVAPVAPVASVAPVAPVTSVAPVSYPVNPAPTFTAPSVAPTVPLGNGGAAANFGGPLSFGGLGPNLPNLPAVNPGNLQIGSGGSASTGVPNGSFLPPI